VYVVATDCRPGEDSAMLQVIRFIGMPGMIELLIIAMILAVPVVAVIIVLLIVQQQRSRQREWQEHERMYPDQPRPQPDSRPVDTEVAEQ
jgi:hypothetical protein